MHQRLGRLAVHRRIGQDHFVHAIIIPLIMRRHLEHPLRHARVQVARKDGHGPFIVARALRRVPRAGIARSVIHQVQARVVGKPAPRAAAAILPLITLPGLQRAVLADRLAHDRGRVRIELDHVVGTGGVRHPGLAAVRDVIRGHTALNAEFAAADADQDLVLDHERGGRAGFTLRRIAVLHGPGNLAGLRIQRHQRGVGLMQENLAVAVGNAAVHRVTAHHRDHVGVLVRLVFPQNAAAIVEVEREHLVWKRRR